MAVGRKDQRQFRDLFKSAIPFSATVDFASTLDGDEAASDITVTGAALGDLVWVSPSIDVADLQLTGTVTAANTVTVVVSNSTGGTVNLASQTIKGVVLAWDDEVGVSGE